MINPISLHSHEWCIVLSHTANTISYVDQIIPTKPVLNSNNLMRYPIKIVIIIYSSTILIKEEMSQNVEQN